MFRPLALAIGLRYTRAKKITRFISFVAVTSMLGIALGVMVLITVLSVMNGFDEEIKTRFFAMAPQVTITGQINDWLKLSNQVDKHPEIVAVSPFVSGQGLLLANGINQPVAFSGIDPLLEQKTSQLQALMQEKRSIDSLTPKSFQIIIGEGIAAKFALHIGDKLTLMISKANVSIVGVQPRFKQFTVSGIFSAGSGFGFDSQIVFISLQDAQRLYGLGNKVTGLKLKLQDVYQAPSVSADLMRALPDHLDISDWSMQFGAFFKAIQLEKNMMFLILVLIVAVATFNLVSSLVMLVNDKQSDIAILRTIGATPTLILQIFIVQGTVIGVFGTMLGLIAGLALASNVTAIVNALQKLIGVQFLSANVYFVDYLPSKIMWQDVLMIVGISLLFSFLATLYPARKAAYTQVSEALRYE